jgi:hypothetical protein
MNVVSLLPVKNEAWILPAYLSSVAHVVDDIVASDDGSTDASRDLVEAAGGHVIAACAPPAPGWAEHDKRDRLLALGRERGGTHFVALDADEALTAPCRVSSTTVPRHVATRAGIALSCRLLSRG